MRQSQWSSASSFRRHAASRAPTAVTGLTTTRRYGAEIGALAQALRLGETHVVTPLDFLRLVFVSILGYLLFDQVPDIFVLGGGVIIFASVTFIAYREYVRRQEKKELVILLKPTVVGVDTWRDELKRSRELLQEWFPDIEQ